MTNMSSIDAIQAIENLTHRKFSDEQRAILMHNGGKHSSCSWQWKNNSFDFTYYKEITYRRNNRP